MKQRDVMNFLNEIALDYPNAISLASGRPCPSFFNKDQWHKYEGTFLDYFAAKRGMKISEAEKLLCQYGPTSGVINDILAQHIKIDESIAANPESIIVTNGCQEALTMIALHEIENDSHCMLTIDPSYIGFSSLLSNIGKRVEAINVEEVSTANGEGTRLFNWDAVERKVSYLKRKGLTAKAIYINPDFNNPLSYRLTHDEKLALMQICEALNLKIIEDNPYSRFNYTECREPALRSLNPTNNVYHIGSFSKTICPGLRLGFLVVPETEQSALKSLIALKSLVSVNTSSYSQSVVAGLLLLNDYSLEKRMRTLNAQYCIQRDAMVGALEKYLSDMPGLSWNVPDGGFFIVLRLPFNFSYLDVIKCARDKNVIVMPVGFFALYPENFTGQVRLAFSYYDTDHLSEGVKRFSEYVIEKLSSY